MGAGRKPRIYGRKGTGETACLWSLDILVWSTRRVARGSRRSLDLWGQRPLGSGAGDVLHPGRGARPAPRSVRAGSEAALAPLPGCFLSDAAFRRSFPTCPERPPATFWQPYGLTLTTECSRRCPNSRDRRDACPTVNRIPRGWRRASWFARCEWGRRCRPRRIRSRRRW